MSTPERPGPVKEPIRMPWVWVGLVLLTVAGVPWYLPEGTIGPTVLGFPLWTLLAIASTLAVCGYLSWMLLRRWNLVENEEEARGSEGQHAGAARDQAATTGEQDGWD